MVPQCHQNKGDSLKSMFFSFKINPQSTYIFRYIQTLPINWHTHFQSKHKNYEYHSLPFSLHNTNRNSATRSLTDVTGVVRSLHSWLRSVLPFSGGRDTSLSGGSTTFRRYFRWERHPRALFTMTVRIGDKFSYWFFVFYKKNIQKNNSDILFCMPDKVNLGGSNATIPKN